jgi:hypothetical protein
MELSPEIKTNWSFLKKIFFRFFFTYFFIYCFPFPVDAFQFLDPVAKPYYNLLDRLIIFVGDKWFHLPAHVAFPTFDKVDDSFYGLVFIYFNLVISLVATFIWTWIDRRRKNYEKLFSWLKLYLRFFLAAYLFGYGFVKVFPSQFQAITASRLTMAVGDQSPMLLAWNFMGYSTTLMKLNGWVEVIAGVLLLSRRTTTLGAILSTAIFSFVVTMDFCFNVPVRLLSSHLLIMSVFLVMNDAKRLLNVFVLNKPAAAIEYQPFIRHATWRKIFSGSLIVLAFCLLYSTIVKGIEAEREFGQLAPHGPLYGVYNTDHFIKNGDTLSSSNQDSVCWKQLVVDGGAWNQSCVIRFNNDKREKFQIIADTIKRNLIVQSKTDTALKFLFNYSIPAPGRLHLIGLWKKDSIDVLMTKHDLSNFLLHREKFEWISE